MRNLTPWLLTALLSLSILFISETATAQDSESDPEIVGSAKIGLICSGMRQEPSMGSDVILELERSKRAKIHDFYQSPFIKVTVDTLTGYTPASCFETNYAIIDVKYADNPKLQTLVRKHGERNAKRIEKSEIWIGMTEEMLIASRGRPNSKNITRSSYGNSEQWVYEKFNYRSDYVYLRNGKVETIQLSE